MLYALKIFLATCILLLATNCLRLRRITPNS